MLNAFSEAIHLQLMRMYETSVASLKCKYYMCPMLHHHIHEQLIRNRQQIPVRCTTMDEEGGRKQVCEGQLLFIQLNLQQAYF